MAIPTSEFWGDNFFQHPSLTDAMVAHAEHYFQVRLPSEYLALLRVQNGGYTNGFVFPSTSSTAENREPYTLHELNGIVPDPGNPTVLNILDPLRLPCFADAMNPLYRQILLAGDGHWWLTLDYRKSDSPSVAYIDVECEYEEVVAPTFAAFLDGLVPDPVKWE